MNTPPEDQSSMSALLDSIGKTATKITTPASFAALVIILFCVVLLMSSDIGQARPWLMGLIPLAGLCMLPLIASRREHAKTEPRADNGTVVLNDQHTKQFVELYQYALAYNISREIDATLHAFQTDRSSYEREFFCSRIWAVVLECRLRASGFCNEKIGRFRAYFESSFPESALRRIIVERYEPLLLNTTIDPIVKRKTLFDSIENVQRRLLADLEGCLEDTKTSPNGG